MTDNLQPSWAEKVAGMIDPHLHVSPDMYLKLKREERNREEGFFTPPSYLPRLGIPVHVEKHLPFIDDEGQEVHIVAIDHDRLKVKAEPVFQEPPRWMFPPTFEFGHWRRPAEFKE
jgi:hypothetical protein